MHPSWKALSSVPFDYKVFVKATEEDQPESSSNESEQSSELKGDEVMNFYNKVIHENSQGVKKEVKKEEPEVKKEVTVDLLSDSEDDISVLDPCANSKLLKAAQSGDIKEVKRSLKEGGDIDCCDEFGWTPLMIASAEGHTDIVKLLLEEGAKLDTEERKGHRADHIARIKGHFEVEDLLRNWSRRKNKRRRMDTHKDEFESCDICREVYPLSEKKKHQASVVHQLELDKSKMDIDPGFIISQSNKGYQLLKKGGWDGMSGLGAEHKGRLFPVKSVLKTDRHGLQEGMAKAAKITHFAANDVESINAQSRIQKKKKAQKDNPQKEISIRESLQGL